MDDFDGLSIPRYIVNDQFGHCVIGPNVEIWFGLRRPNGKGYPDYSAVVAAKDLPAFIDFLNGLLLTIRAEHQDAMHMAI